MKEHLTLSTKENEIRMLLDHPNYRNVVFVFLEGHADIKTFRPYLNEDNTSLEAFEGKANVMSIVDNLSGESDVIGICDADFDHILKVSPPANIFITDTHDVETMMIGVPAFDAMLNEIVIDGERLRHLKAELLDQIFPVCTQIGVLKLVNKIQGLGLNFEGIQTEKFLEVSEEPFSIQFCLDSFIQEVIGRSSTEMSPKSLKYEYENYSGSRYDQLQICNGHDICRMVSSVVGVLRATDVSNLNQDRVESFLRTSYISREYFLETRLYDTLSTWQSGRLVKAV